MDGDGDDAARHTAYGERYAHLCPRSPRPHPPPRCADGAGSSAGEDSDSDSLCSFLSADDDAGGGIGEGVVAPADSSGGAVLGMSALQAGAACFAAAGKELADQLAGKELSIQHAGGAGDNGAGGKGSSPRDRTSTVPPAPRLCLLTPSPPWRTA
jgi:hypothetical protein